MKAKRTAEQCMFQLKGKVALITGASGLLGGEFAAALALYGANLVLTDVRPERARAVAAEINKRYGVEAVALKGDVGSEQSWRAVLRMALSRMGQIDVLVNNAAYTNKSRSRSYGAAIEDVPIEDWETILKVNLTGTFLGCKTVGAHMLKRGVGSIVNLASLYGVVSPHHRIYEGTGVLQPPAYSVSKAGVIGLTRYLGSLWADRGVRVNCITPGGVFDGHQDPFLSRFSHLNPLGRMCRKEELRGAVVYLASDASSAVIGHNLVVDGGWTVW